MADMTSILTRLGAEPIAPDTPCGVSVRYEPEYDRLETEIAKLESLTSQGTAEPVDWGQVVDLGVVILRDKSKDLLVASYLGCGLLEVHGYAGLEVALTITCELLETFWDGLFPEKKRLRGRLAAISWMTERLGSVVTRRQPTESEYAVLPRCQGLLDRLELWLTEELGEQEARDLLSLLSRPLRERMASLVQQEAPTPGPPATDEPPVASEERRETAETAVAAAPPEEDVAVAPTLAQAEVTQEDSRLTEPPTQDATAATPEPREAKTATPSAAGVSSPVLTTFETETDVQQALRGCQTSLRNAAAFWLRQNLAHPLAYRLTRIGTWMLVSELPQHQNQVTQLSRPQPEVVQGYEDALQAGHYANLIPEVEAHFTRAPFWLDGHRFTATSLDALGPTYAAAKQTVVTELASFVHRLPGVLDLKFADGTPFADEPTRAWIDGEVLERSHRAGVLRTVPLQRREVETATPQVDGAQPTPWVQVREEADRLAAAGSVIAATVLLQDGLRQAASQRERFMWRLQQAGFCYETGLLEVAIPQLEFLQEQGERFALDEWEPALSLEVIQLLLRCYYALVQKTKKPKAELVDKAERLHARLCRLDVTAALAMDEHV